MSKKAETVPEEKIEETKEYTQKDLIKSMTKNIREIKYPNVKREEFFIYLDISLDCFEVSLVDEIFVNATMERHVKGRIDDYLNKNRYIEYEASTVFTSFYAFSGYIFYDGGNHLYEHNKSVVVSKVMEKIATHPNNMSLNELREFSRIVKEAHKQYRMENELYDFHSYIVAKEHCDNIFDFLTDKKVFETLFKEAKKEMETSKEHIYKAILESKQKYFRDRLEKIYPLVLKDSGLTINWYMSINEYVERLDELIPEEKDKNVNQLLQIKVLYLLKSLSEQLDIDTKHESFWKLMAKITGGKLDAIRKHLMTTNMNCSDEAHVKNILATIHELKELQTRQPQKTKSNPNDNPLDNITPIINKLLKDIESIKSIRNNDEITELKKKYKK